MTNRQDWFRSMLLVGVALACSCATTTFQSTWKSADARPLRLTGKKVVAVFVTKDPAFRRRAEDALAREITSRGAEGVASYTFIADADVKDTDAAKAKAEQLGFAGAVVMRVAGRETIYEARPVGGAWFGGPYRHFWGGYWGYGWGSVWAPGYLTADRVVKVETLVYSLDQDQLVWAGLSRTVDPGKIESFISDLADAVTKEMASEGLFARNG